jgi:hypothetical protein
MVVECRNLKVLTKLVRIEQRIRELDRCNIIWLSGSKNPQPVGASNIESKYIEPKGGYSATYHFGLHVAKFSMSEQGIFLGAIALKLHEKFWSYIKTKA